MPWLGIKCIAFAKVALIAFAPKVVVNGLSAFRPRNDVIHVQVDPACLERASATRLASETVPNQDAKSLAIRYLASGSAFGLHSCIGIELITIFSTLVLRR
jgi:hypothetical protein